ncbi:MAG: DUF3080 family protein, partial [Pseudomonadota bacterium]
MKVKRPGLLLLLMLLGSCGSASDPASEYVRRIARVLEQPIPTLRVDNPVPLPAIRELRQPFAGAKVDWVEFAQLHRCDIGDLLGYRNSSLGRVMSASERYRYERRWVTVAARCQAGLGEADVDTRALLERLRAAKARDSETAFWNLVFAGTAMQRWLRESQSPGPDAPSRPSAADALVAISTASPWREPGDARAGSSRALDLALQQLSGADGGGGSTATWRLADAQLRSVA